MILTKEEVCNYANAVLEQLGETSTWLDPEHPDAKPLLQRYMDLSRRLKITDQNGLQIVYRDKLVFDYLDEIFEGGYWEIELKELYTSIPTIRTQRVELRDMLVRAKALRWEEEQGFMLSCMELLEWEELKNGIRHGTYRDKKVRIEAVDEGKVRLSDDAINIKGNYYAFMVYAKRPVLPLLKVWKPVYSGEQMKHLIYSPLSAAADWLPRTEPGSWRNHILLLTQH